MTNLQDLRMNSSIKEYEFAVDLHKFYWSAAMRISGFYLVAVGSLLSFYASQTKNTPNINAIPITVAIISAAFFILCAYGSLRNLSTIEWFDHIVQKIREIEGAIEYVVPDTNPLSIFLLISQLLSLLIGCFGLILSQASNFCIGFYCGFLLVAFGYVFIRIILSYREYNKN